MDMPKIICRNISKEDLKTLDNGFKSLYKYLLKKDLDRLYLECEHGDEEHRKWLKDKFNDFLERKSNEEK